MSTSHQGYINPPLAGTGQAAWRSRLVWVLASVVSLGAFVDDAVALREPAIQGNVLKIVDRVAWTILPIVFVIVAALIVSRQPHNRIGWLLMTPGIVLVAGSPIDAYLGSLKTAPPPTLLNLIITWFASWSWLLLVFPLTLIPLLFPTGRPPSPRWRWVIAYTGALALLFVVFASLGQNLHESNDVWLLPNPIGVIPDRPQIINLFLTPWIAGVGVLVVASALSLVVRYRRAAGMERVQIRWLLYASGIFACFYVPLLAWPNTLQGPVGDLADLLLMVTASLFPVAIAIAILRHRLWDIDVIIRRTLVYSTVTILLALTYFGSVALLQAVLAGIIGQHSPVAIVLSTLSIAALFNPVRRRVQKVLDRRFFRRKYDAQQVISAFVQAARDETDIERLTAELERVVLETMQPESASLWLPGKPE